jgi:hypothetical protein
MSSLAGPVLALVFAVGLARLWLHRNRARRIEEARRLAQDLLPEIRSVMASCDPAGSAGGAPTAAGRFALVRQRLPRILPKESLFAVETFYQCVDAYASASTEMTAAFAAESDLSLGDRIRAKERRDRCLKDVYYTGEAALERLQGISGP